MSLLDYFGQLSEGVEFLIALGSIIGLLTLVVALTFLIWGGSRMRRHMIGMFIFAIILLALCGVDTGLRYFHIFN
jgi:hypothetical protein